MKAWTPRLARFAAPLAAAGLLLAGLLYLGRASRDALSDHPRYAVRFADIDCNPPPGLSRGRFLGEVRYVARPPAEFSALEGDLPGRLADAFAAHPLVEKVEAVEVTPGPAVRVRLAYRTPALAVRWKGRLWAVDGRGVLLPARTPTDGLPQFPGEAAAPPGPAGTPWGDPAVVAEAAQAAALTPAPAGAGQK